MLQLVDKKATNFSFPELNKLISKEERIMRIEINPLCNRFPLIFLQKKKIP